MLGTLIFKIATSAPTKVASQGVTELSHSHKYEKLPLFAEQAKRRGAFLPLMCVNISLYLGVQPRFHDGSLSFSHFCLFFCLFSCGKQSRYSLLISLVPIISTLLFNSSFSNAIRSKIITKQTFSFALQTVVVILLLNNNDGRNYHSTILHVKVRTKYAEVNILKKEVAIKLNIQLAS